MTKKPVLGRRMTLASRLPRATISQKSIIELTHNKKSATITQFHTIELRFYFLFLFL